MPLKGARGTPVSPPNREPTPLKTALPAPPAPSNLIPPQNSPTQPDLRQSSHWTTTTLSPSLKILSPPRPPLNLTLTTHPPYMFRIFKMAEAAAKRMKPTLQIGTHSGHFHADEALAVHMLRSLPTYASSSLVRTRDPALLADCHTVVDVGGEYDAATNRYDHHQRTFSTTFPSRDTKLSSAGLVYLHFGKDLIRRKIGLEEGVEDTPEVDLVWKKLYEAFVEALDAHDNGISAYDTAALDAAGLKKRFSDGNFSLGAMVGRRNRGFGDPTPQDFPDLAAAQRDEDERFLSASKLIGTEFDLTLDYYSRSWLPARSIVVAAYEKRAEFDPQGRVMVFEGASAPWKDHLYSLEGDEAKVLYVLYPESAAPGAKWRVQAVSVSKDSFASRKPLPEAWRGFRDEELDGISGVEGCVFVHAAGFIGGNKTFEGAKAMVAKALEM
ncbi:MYG1 family protein [Candidatus Bathyarchaeota archaeon]|nr:MYG1 family protein [Candidatus Bathyarchaeota archaeon]